MRHLVELVLAAGIAMAGAGCEAPVSNLHGPDARTSAESTPATCLNVEGTGSISGDPFPNEQGNVVASGPIRGDVTGTLTIKRTPRATDQKGNGATFATYHSVILETDTRGDFTGTGEANFNFGMFEEGERTDTGVVRLDYDGPGDRHGSMTLRAEFDLSDFPLIRADYDYNGRLCGDS